MSKPLVVVVPHQLGRAAARQRLVDGVEKLRTAFGDKVANVEDKWTNDHLDVRLGVMGQSVSSGIDVADDHVRLEVQLPWMLALIAEKAKGYLQKEGHLLLEKKK